MGRRWWAGALTGRVGVLTGLGWTRSAFLGWCVQDGPPPRGLPVSELLPPLPLRLRTVAVVAGSTLPAAEPRRPVQTPPAGRCRGRRGRRRGGGGGEPVGVGRRGLIGRGLVFGRKRVVDAVSVALMNRNSFSI